MTKIKTVEEIIKAVYSPDVFIDDMIEAAITLDRTTTLTALCEAIDKEINSFRFSNFKGRLDYELGLEKAKNIIRTTPFDVRKATIKEITHEWNKGELQLDGTTQGAINCIEHFRNYLATLSTKEHETQIQSRTTSRCRSAA